MLLKDGVIHYTMCSSVQPKVLLCQNLINSLHVEGPLLHLQHDIQEKLNKAVQADVRPLGHQSNGRLLED